jgi:steroid delta-isomerase-like uncharacterized protein
LEKQAQSQASATIKTIAENSLEGVEPMLQLDAQNSAVLRRHVSAECNFDMPGTLATLTHDCVFEDMAVGIQYHGHDGARRYYQEWWNAFGNAPSNSQLNVVSDRHLIVETRFLGKHCGPYQGMAASNRVIDLPVVIFVAFRDGLMSGERFYYDRATLLAQINPA